ncbi:MAG: hypothetical protein AB1Z65_02310 [Candidatus Sulfomarinibacteraceae bacterium]
MDDSTKQAIEPPPMRVCGIGSLFEALGDSIVYRSLQPVDRRLPGLRSLRPSLGLQPRRVPRKAEPAYGRVVGEILRAAGALSAGRHDFDRVILIGDTRHSDGAAFVNICTALDCPGDAFICSETPAEPELVPHDRGSGRTIHLATRWRSIGAFEAQLARQGATIGRGTVVIVDIDKTILGARGRNHRPIDTARAAAVVRTARELRGEAVNRDLLLAAYNHFNDPQFHAFTTDNQDYLAYLAMLVESGWSSIEKIREGIARGRLGSFGDLLNAVSATVERLPNRLRRAHDNVVMAVEIGDPTPFKDFRRAEYRETVDRMAPPGKVEDMARLLATRITLTAEVWRRIRLWRDRGALLFGLSDKPDEASFPSAELETQGYQPLHITRAMVVGEG